MSAPARRRSRAPLWEPGLIPAPGGLLDWRDARHFDRWQDLPCVLCEQPTPMRSHHGESVHKTCVEDWISANPTQARLGRFASDAQPKGGKDYDDHA
ncbi:hypothetical protein ABZU45_31720 [Streptomyces avermitilis]|uniref:hypothetical protein n=1 Tax=Streptomyces avermitilis TaxID=33903 RepID=UPI0033B3BDE4